MSKKIKVVKAGEGKFGPWVMIGKDEAGNGIFLSVDKPLTLADFPIGKELEVEVRKGKTGKENISKIVGKEVAAEKAVASEPVRSAAPVVPAVPAKQRDFDAEARGKTRCALYEAALSSPALQQYLFNKEADLDAIHEACREMAERGFKYVFGE